MGFGEGEEKAFLQKSFSSPSPIFSLYAYRTISNNFRRWVMVMW